MSKKTQSGSRGRVAPTGKCWCGCGEETAGEAFFLPGHDRIAESGFIKNEYGTVVDMLAAHGYRSGIKTRKAG